MKLVEAIIDPGRLDGIRENLAQVGVAGLTVSEITGTSRRKGRRGCRGAEPPESRAKVKLEVLVDDRRLDRVLAAIETAGGPDGVGGGRVFVLPVNEVVRIRTGERDTDAI